MGLGDLGGLFVSEAMHTSSVLYFNLPFAGYTSMAHYMVVFPAWMMWYLLYSMAVNQVIRKAYRIGFPQ